MKRMEIRTTLRTDKQTAQQITEAADQLNIPKSVLLNSFIREGLMRLQKQPSTWLNY